ncbi:hypothetical protein GIB67_007422 [Kingdonia uniflora]|uniref:non-specific serine/threonine protein kinase n=1 Tax=Kingdonia uniflora TaxID=39325 RepID=A0A7J7MLH6_9MAGN|nr:hypothetical protein GIB67_007422 [Kingdonia uniflora]
MITCTTHCPRNQYRSDRPAVWDKTCHYTSLDDYTYQFYLLEARARLYDTEQQRLAKQASELHAKYHPPFPAATPAAPAIPTVTALRTFALDGMRKNVIATVQRVLQDEDEEETGMHTTFVQDGIEVAWNQIKLGMFFDDEAMMMRTFNETWLLREMSHENILECYNVWLDEEHDTLNFITEVCTSGSLRDYREKHRRVSLKAMKKWPRQILRGLEYLHMHKPCIIHRDIKCNNIFINDSTGGVKIGDFG